MATRSIQEKITAATERLAKLKAREMLAEQRSKAKTRASERKADAHRKILLGGAVIAAGADSLDEAELVGLLLGYREHISKPAFVQQRNEMRTRGRMHLAEREASRAKKR
ncbi:conjugal transfer protein TraD [Stenotrophomonas geniculata]|uniref:conjugal transfer protein TraD n=1 Tax=Stenotrophomonas geniculata TaxID=86188 RepID=UPI0009EC4A29|nr:conjugal transfer protein TraD [Stenotrophomonas geniculata]CAH0064129.1 conserved protein of unknown function [Stenotrophomonas maltophilia]HCL43465.1 hypothetical protein [Pseudomonas sp.]